MLISDAVYTRKTAQEVASALAYLREHPTQKIKLDVAIHRKTGANHPAVVTDREFWVSYIASPQTSIVSLANGGEIVRLRTEEGRRLDVVFGQPAEREFEPALVLLESE